MIVQPTLFSLCMRVVVKHYNADEITQISSQIQGTSLVAKLKEVYKSYT